MSRVMIHPATYENATKAVNLAFEIFPLNLKNKKILIKPNVLRASEAKEAIVTHPAVLQAVVKAVESMEPSSIIVGDNPGVFSYGANEEGFRKTGLMEASGGYYRNIGTDAQRIDFNPEYMPSLSVSRAVLDADIIISLPKFKTHGLTVISGAIKNSYGFLPGAQKAHLHKIAGTPARFHDMVVDVFRIRVPDLFIVDAVVGMEGNGPASPDLRNIGVILASDNAVAMDAVISFMMGCDPGRLGFLQKAKQEGLGDFDLKTIEIIGELKRIHGFKLPPLGGEANIDNPAIQAVLAKPVTLVPKANTQSCTGCGDCIEQCPVSALWMAEKFPEADTKLCIRCFCCQEICPEKAMTLV